ncbi:MAG: hypothetical protein U0V87_09720 [Acidobacteriota bacterium]
MSLIFAQLVWGAIVPAVIAAAVLAAAALFLRGRGERGAWVGSIAVGAGFLAAQAGFQGLPPFPAVQATQWVFWVVAVTCLVGVLWPTTTWLRWTTRVVLVGLALSLGLRSLVAHQWTAGQSVLWLLTLGVLTLLYWGGLSLNASALERGAWFPILLQVSGAGAALSLVLTGSAVLGVLAGAATATCGAAMVAALIWREWPFQKYLMAPFVIAVGMLSVNGKFFSDTPSGCGVLLAIGPVAAHLLVKSLAGRVSERRATWLRVAVVGVFSLAAIVLAAINQPAPDESRY